MRQLGCRRRQDERVEAVRENAPLPHVAEDVVGKRRRNGNERGTKHNGADEDGAEAQARSRRTPARQPRHAVQSGKGAEAGGPVTHAGQPRVRERCEQEPGRAGARRCHGRVMAMPPYSSARLPWWACV